MRKVVIVNQSSGYLTTEIANAFWDSGKYDSVVLMLGNDVSNGLRLDKSVSIVKIPPYNKRSFKTRLLSWLNGTFSVIKQVRRMYRDAELFLISNPPTVSFIPLFLRNKYSTLIYDVYPNGLVDGGFISKKNIIYKIWAARNKRFFKNAQRVFTITSGMADTIASYCDRDKIEVVSLWSNPNIPVLNLKKEDNIFLKEYNLVGKFIVMYSGNIGKGHDLDVLVDVANILREYKDIVFVFVGEGYLKPIIKGKAEKYELNNVLLMPYQDRAMLPYSLSCSDLAVVSTNKQSGKVCIPSKTFDLMRLGRPILCIAEDDSDIANLLRKHNIGKSFTREQTKEISAFILHVYNHPEELDEFSRSSFEAAKNYTSELAYKFI